MADVLIGHFVSCRLLYCQRLAIPFRSFCHIPPTETPTSFVFCVEVNKTAFYGVLLLLLLLSVPLLLLLNMFSWPFERLSVCSNQIKCYVSFKTKAVRLSNVLTFAGGKIKNSTHFWFAEKNVTIMKTIIQSLSWLDFSSLNLEFSFRAICISTN